jgi:translation elongation factor EF-G
MELPMNCNCPSCQDDRKWDDIVERGDVEELKQLVQELRERLCNAESELDIDEAILAGEWPSSKQYAEAILARLLRKEADPPIEGPA